MEKLKPHLPLVLFILFFLKVIIFPFSYPEVAVLTILAAFTGFCEYKNNEKKIKEFENKFEQFVKDQEDQNRKIEELKTAISSMKLSALSRPLSNAR